MTLLHLASAGGHVYVARLLIEHGADAAARPIAVLGCQVQKFLAGHHVTYYVICILPALQPSAASREYIPVSVSESVVRSN